MPDTSMDLPEKATELMCVGEEDGEGKAPPTGRSVGFWSSVLASLVTTPWPPQLSCLLGSACRRAQTVLVPLTVTVSITYFPPHPPVPSSQAWLRPSFCLFVFFCSEAILLGQIPPPAPPPQSSYSGSSNVFFQSNLAKSYIRVWPWLFGIIISQGLVWRFQWDVLLGSFLFRIS